jgi:hypothetical protein
MNAVQLLREEINKQLDGAVTIVGRFLNKLSKK